MSTAMTVPPPDTSWMSPQEKWAWQQICAGEKADLSKLPQEVRDGFGEHAAAVAVELPLVKNEDGTLQPVPDEAWPPWQILTARFIEQMLAGRACISIRARNRVWIESARITGEVFLDQESCPGDINLVFCRIDDALRLMGADIGGVLGLQGSHCVGGLMADRLKTGGAVFLRGNALYGSEVRLLDASIGGNFDCNTSQFHAGENGYTLNCNGLRTAGTVFLNNGTRFFGEVNLMGADIDGALECGGSHFTAGKSGDALSAAGLKTRSNVLFNSYARFEGEVNLLGARIGGNLVCSGAHFTAGKSGDALSGDRLDIGEGIFLNDGALFEGEVRLLGAQINGDLSCSGSRFVAGKSGDAISAYNLRAGGNVYLRSGSRFEGNLQFVAARIEGSLQLSASHFDGAIDLSGASIAGELRLDDSALYFEAPEWGTKAELNLRNARIGALQGSLAAFQRNGDFILLELDGLKVERLAGGQGGDSLDGADAGDIVSWIEAGARRPVHRDRGFPISPYVTTAAALDAAGRSDTARQVRIALENRLTRDMQPGARKAFRNLLWAVNGYGYSPYQGLWWALVFTLIFAVIGFFWAEGGPVAALGALWGTGGGALIPWLGYSFDQIVPFIELDPVGDNFLQNQFGTPTNEFGYADESGLPPGVRALFMLERIIGIVILTMSIAGITAWAERRS